MDTRYWGPSGWRFLHQITFAYDPGSQRKAIKTLFTSLPFVLPCKFCRASLTEYMLADPLAPALESRDLLTKWLWRIHNQVNAKLRSQGQTVAPDPTFESVRSFYEDNLASGCTRVYFPGWEFLFSVAENHPLSRSSLNSSPMPNAPTSRSPGMSIDDLNRYNLLKPRERLLYFRKFWNSVGDCLPFQEWRSVWIRKANQLHLSTAVQSRISLLKALWKIRCALEESLELQGKTKFADLCSVLVEHRSGCSKSRNARTCRKPRGTRGAKTLKH